MNVSFAENSHTAVISKTKYKSPNNKTRMTKGVYLKKTKKQKQDLGKQAQHIMGCMGVFFQITLPMP